MNYLEEYGFTSEEIYNLEEDMPSRLREKLVNNYKLVCQNLSFLKNLGVANYKDIFAKYYDMFLMDYSNFTSIFKKYDTADLIDKLNKNVEIIEFL